PLPPHRYSKASVEPVSSMIGDGPPTALAARIATAVVKSCTDAEPTIQMWSWAAAGWTGCTTAVTAAAARSQAFMREASIPADQTDMPPTARQAAGMQGKLGRSAAVELDHQVGLHLHGERNLAEAWNAHELGGHLVVVRLDVVGHVALGTLDRLQEQ